METLVRNIQLIVFDFDGVFTDNTVYVDQHGTESVRCSRLDGIGLRKLDAIGVQYVVLSSEENPVVSQRCQKLKIRCVQGCKDKAQGLADLLQEYGVTTEQTAFVGNDANDIPALERVALPIVVQDAHPDVLPYAKHKTQTKGGLGAVREVCDWFAAVHTEAS